MKKIFFLFGIIFVLTSGIYAQAVIDLDGSQSMCITGKGPGQDGAINPYSGSDSTAIVRNMGKNEFSIRVQMRGKIIEIIPIHANETIEVELSKGFELYFDSEQSASASVAFRKK